MYIIVGGEGSFVRIAMCCRNGSEARTEYNVGSELLLFVLAGGDRNGVVVVLV